MSVFRSTTATDGDVATVTFEGELDLSSAPQAESELTALEREDGRAGTLVLDLRGLRFLDSTGLRVDPRGRLASPPRQPDRCRSSPGPEAVHRVFRIALLDRRLEFVEPAAEGGTPMTPVDIRLPPVADSVPAAREALDVLRDVGRRRPAGGPATRGQRARHEQRAARGPRRDGDRSRSASRRRGT